VVTPRSRSRGRWALGVVATALAALAGSACEGLAGVRDLTLGGGGSGSGSSTSGSGIAALSSYRYGESGKQWGDIVLADGAGIVLAGRATGQLDFGGPAAIDPGEVGNDTIDDLYVARLDADGVGKWEHRFADTNVGGAALAGNGDILLGGAVWNVVDLGDGTTGSTRDAVILRLDSAGQQRWSLRWGDDADQVTKAVAVDPEGNALVVGLVRGTIQLDPAHVLVNDAGWSVFVVKLDPAGGVLWSKAFGSSTLHLVPTAIAADKDGAPVFVGYFIDPITFGGDTLTGAKGRESAFVVKLDKDGNHLWSHAFGGSGDTRAHGVALGPDGAVFSVGIFSKDATFGGASQGSPDALGTNGFLAKLASDGSPAWVRALSEPEGSNTTTRRPVYGVAAAPDGDVVLVGDGGYAVGLVVFDPAHPTTSARAGVGAVDFMIARYSGSGTLVWASLFGDSAHGNSVAIDPIGAIWATGYFDGNLDLGVPPVQVSHGGNDIFLARFAP
jgi:hypothetical protein